MRSSYWLDTVPPERRFPPLSGDQAADVAVIGAGITGLMTAYGLVRAGKRVIVLEKDTVGAGETAHTTAFLMYPTDASLQELHGTFGDAGAKAAWQSGKGAIDLLEEAIQREGIACDFKRIPAYLYATDEDGWQGLKKEQELAKEFGFRTSLSEAGAPFSSRGVLTVPGQAKFHPRAFLRGLAEAVIRHGGTIYEGTMVERFDAQDAHRLLTRRGSVTARQVVIATHAPMGHPIEVPSRLQATQSYALAVAVPMGTLPEALYLDTEKPYHYLRVDPREGHDLLILGGEDRPTGDGENTADRFQALETHLKTRLIPGVPVETVARWSGEIFSTADGLPYIGHSFTEKDHYVASGYAGNGMTFGAVAAMVICDLILGRVSAYADLYSPQRLKGVGATLSFGAHFAKELVRRVVQSAEVDLKDLPAGQGRIIERDGKKIAVFRTPAGDLIGCSAICTHLGCVVAWNQAETTWDCPCHGSRFSHKGKTLNGPATEDLARVDL